VRKEHDVGGYSYLPGGRFTGCGVIASPGMVIEHAVLPRPRPLRVGLDPIRRHLDRIGRPLEALCGIDLRLPGAMRMTAYRDHGERCLAYLNAWGLLRDGACPLTTTGVAPSVASPAEPALVAFSYTTTGRRTRRPACLLVCGVAELAIGARFPGDVVRHGETGFDALAEKAAYVAREIGARIAALGASWEPADRVRLCSAHPAVFEAGRRVLAGMGVHPEHGLIWYEGAPPVVGLELQMDVRRHARELVLEDL
jgi:hypothetical protein